MVCECTTLIVEQIRKDFDDDKARVEWSNIMDMNTRESTFRWPSAVIKHRKRNKDGSFSVKFDSTKLFPTFCPMCGKKYEENPDTVPEYVDEFKL